MKKVAVVTDSNAGIRQKEAKELGIFVLPITSTSIGLLLLMIKHTMKI
jgi:fatty acid-binding protein DegV